MSRWPPSAAERLAPGEVRPVGDAALLFGAPDAATAGRVATRFRDEGHPGVVEVVGGQRSVLVVLEPGATLAEPVAGELAASCRRSEETGGGRRVELPVRFHGADLEQVGELTGLGVEGVIDRLEQAELVVDFLGFSPGFAYLSGLPESLRRVPRRRTPRPSVPAGSFAVAAGFAAVYPWASPGGWQLLGRTDVPLFDPSVAPYAVLAPGDRIHVRAEDRSGGDATGGPPAPARGGPLGAVPGTDGHAAPAEGGDVPAGTSPDDAAPSPAVAPRAPVSRATAMVVESPGMLTLVQDAGRSGWAHLGVPAAGPADPVAHELANRLVGNPPAAAALEVTGGGLSLRAAAALHVALVGQAPEARLDGWELPAGRVVPVGPGQRLVVRHPGRWARCSLAFRGGLAVASVLGSASTDTLSGLGPPPLRRGDRLAVGPGRARLADHLVVPPSELAGDTVGPGPRALRVLPGPHPEWFPPDVLDRLARTEWTVSPTSNRVGLRLTPDGPTPLERRPGELDPQGMVLGAVQVPPDGDPVILGADHATHGGYPVLAVVVAADRHLLGRCRPGDALRLLPVTTEAARSALDHLRRSVRAATAGTYPSVPG